MHNVVVVGGGFGGLKLVRSLRRAPVEVTLVDRRNHHLFQPLLYQVATGGLSPANIATPLRNILRRQKNVRVVLGEVTGIDVERKRVILQRGELPYDTLVLAAGSSHSYFGHNEWAPHAPGLKSLDDATAIRRQILLAFEAAELARDRQRIESLLTFAIVGAGPTGVEMAGAIADVAKDSMHHEFRDINPADARILLIEATDRVLPMFPSDLSQKAQQFLERLGVTVMTGWRVVRVAEDHLLLQRGDEERQIWTRNVIWAAGVQASPLARLVGEATGATIDRSGRVQVEPDLSVPGHPDVFVIGDMAHYSHQDGKPLPALAPVAMQQGEFVAKVIESRVRQTAPPKPFRYVDYGNMATVGRRMAVADLRGWHFAGAFAWFMWLFVHLMQIVERENRILVFIQWAWHYVTHNRSARLITGKLQDDELIPEAHQGVHDSVTTAR